MTEITYPDLPNEFKKAEYTFDLYLLLKEFENSFDKDLTKIILNIEIRIEDSFDQVVNIFELNDNVGVLTIPFKRYMKANKLSDLPNQNEFFSTIRFALNQVVKDYNNKKGHNSST